VLDAALNAPSELEEGASAVLQSEGSVVGRAQLSEVDASSNLDDVRVLDDSAFGRYSDRRYVGKAAPVGDGVLKRHDRVQLEV